jgi:diguanylate cyclase (GGDEF)-like protein
MKYNKTRSQKFLVLRFLGAVLLPALLLSLSVTVSLRQIHKQYLFTQKELLGSQATYQLFQALTDLQDIRGLSHMLLWSNATVPNEQQRNLNERFRNHFTTPQWKMISNGLGLEKDVTPTMFEAAHFLETKDNIFNETTRFEGFTSIIESINSSMLIVSNRSNLILDSELDTYYMVDTAIKQIPDLSEAFAIIRGLGSGMIARGKTTPIEDDLFKEKISVMQDNLSRFQRIQSIIQKATPETILFYNDNKLNRITTTFLQTCTLVLKGQYHASAEDFFNDGSSVIAVLIETFDSNLNLLEKRLRQRATQQLQLMKLILILSILTFIIIFYFALSFFRIQQNSYRELEQISITDPLTSIPNRRYLDTTFSNEMRRARRDGSSMAFGLMDIDFFKKYNDTYGHQEGDIALQKVAQSLKNTLQRAGDFYFRFGGEEFCFLCRVTSQAEAEVIAEHIRAAIEQLAIAHRESNASSVLTGSLGVIFIPEVTNDELGYAIKQADDLLYQAKAKGRNQCVVMAPTS